MHLRKMYLCLSFSCFYSTAYVIHSSVLWRLRSKPFKSIKKKRKEKKNLFLSTTNDDGLERQSAMASAYSPGYSKNNTTSSYLSHFSRLLISARSVERWGNISPWTENRFILACCKSNKSPKLGVICRNAVHCVCRHPWHLESMGKLTNMKLWLLLLQWVIKSFVSDPGVSCFFCQHILNSYRLIF